MMRFRRFGLVAVGVFAYGVAFDAVVDLMFGGALTGREVVHEAGLGLAFGLVFSRRFVDGEWQRLKDTVHAQL